MTFWAPFLYAGDTIPPASFEIPQGAYSANWVEDTDHITVMNFAGDYDMTLADGSANRAARAVVAKEFYKNHPDNYDFLVIFTSFEFSTPGARAFMTPAQNQTKGIGRDIFNYSSLYGSNGKLKGVIDMAAVSRAVMDPADPAFEDVLATLAHETLHFWASNVHFTNANGERDGSLLGKDGAHWSFFMDSGASVELGNKWKDEVFKRKPPA